MADPFAFYCLEGDPFDGNPPRNLYLGTGHRKALAALHYGLEANSGIHLLLGNGGLGKTALLQHFARRASAFRKTAFLSLAQGIPGQVMRYDLSNAGVKLRSDEQISRANAFESVISLTHKTDSPLLVVVDGLVELDEPLLKQIISLAVRQPRDNTLLHVVLAGRPALCGRLRAHLDFIAFETWIHPLSVGETEAYIRHRLRLQGAGPEGIFTSDACAVIFERSSGVPEKINQICLSALRLGAERELPRIESSALRNLSTGETAIQPMTQKSSAHRRSLVKWLIAPLSILFVLLIGYQGERLLPGLQRTIKVAAPGAVSMSAPSSLANPTGRKTSATLGANPRNLVTRPDASSVSNKSSVVASPNEPLLLPRVDPKISTSVTTAQNAPKPLWPNRQSTEQTDRSLPPPTNEAPAAAQRADDEAAIGDNFMEMGKYDQAILSYRTVLARFPNNPELLRKLERARRAQAAEEQVLQQR